MRLIDADEYIEKLRERIGIEPTWSHSGLRIAIFELHNMPTIDPVVRCKDCIYSKPYNSVWVSPKQPNLLWCAMFDDHREKTWYCADGERREDERL